MSFWTLDNDQTVGYLRHAETIAATSRWPHSSSTACSALASSRASTRSSRTAATSSVSPQEQGNLQMLTFVGMLESYVAIPGDVPHYTAPGDLQGYYLRSIKGNRPEIFFDLYKPFDHEWQT